MFKVIDSKKNNTRSPDAVPIHCTKHQICECWKMFNTVDLAHSRHIIPVMKSPNPQATPIMNLFFSVSINEILIRIFVFDTHRTLFTVYKSTKYDVRPSYLLLGGFVQYVYKTSWIFQIVNRLNM
jgi:hypothetical protein